MDSTLNQTTEMIPSGFGMPGYAAGTCASAPVAMTATAAFHGTGLSGVEATVAAGVVTGDLAVAADDRRAIRKPFPGPTAWSPPTS